MKKLFVFLIALLTLSSTPVQIFAQDPPVPTSAGMHWFCLSAPKDQAIIEDHIAKLYTKSDVGWQPEKKVNVVVRIAYDHTTDGALNLNENNSAMTTANDVLDGQILGGTDGLKNLKDKLGFVVGKGYGVIEGNPIVMKSGEAITWHDDLKDTMKNYIDRAHYWYGVQEAAVVPDTTSGGAGALQNGTFTFSTAGGQKDCDIIRWDPFGYVFDAQTHGPVVGASVRILSSITENGAYTPVPVGIGKGMVGQNPILTHKDGSYRFYVDPGYYKLEISNYTIEKDITQIKSGFEEFGYEQLYLAETPEVIHEFANKVERRDIAIETIGAPAPFSDGPKLKDMLVSSSEKDGVLAVRINGMVSQIPVDLIAVYKDNDGTVVNEEKYNLVHGHNYVPSGLHDERNFDIFINSESKDGGIFKELKVISKYSSKIITVAISPMPSYLNGIATTRLGTPIIGGTVEVYPIGSKKPSYTTKIDESGKFEVKTEWIPPMPYELRYKTITGDIYKVSTSEYLKQNARYHADKQINSFSVKKDEASNITKKNAKVKNIVSGRAEASDMQKTGSTLPSGSQGVIMIVVVLFVLILVGVGVFIMMKSKQQ